MRILLNITIAYFCITGLGSSYGQTEDQVNIFAKAAKFNDVSEVRSLLKRGVSPNTLDARGNPMLILAIKDKSTGVVSLLLSDKKTDIDLSNKYGETPLMIAAIEGDLPMVKTLVGQKNAMVDHIGWTPLHYASTRGHLDVAQYLIANGATVDSQSLNGTTPLIMAVQSGNEQLVKLLLDKGADIKISNNLGFTAIDIADIYDKPWIGDVLRTRWQKLYIQPYASTAKTTTPKP